MCEQWLLSLLVSSLLLMEFITLYHLYYLYVQWLPPRVATAKGKGKATTDKGKGKVTSSGIKRLFEFFP